MRRDEPKRRVQAAGGRGRGAAVKSLGPGASTVDEDDDELYEKEKGGKDETNLNDE